MSSPIVFSLTSAQRDCLATLALCRAAWLNFRKPIRLALLRMGLVACVDRPTLTPAGTCASGLALFLTKASPVAVEKASAKAARHAAEFYSAPRTAT